jgi:hypothetical protein
VRLTINNEDVSYSLEHERTLGEVVAGIREWLAAGGFVITAMDADKRDLLRSPADAWGKASVKDILTLTVAAAHTGDMKIAHWQTVETWLDMLAEEIGRLPAPGSAGDAADEPLADLLQGLPQTLEGFRANPFLPPGSDAGTRFAAAFDGATLPGIRAWPPGRRKEAVELVRELRGLVHARLEDSRNPEASLARCVTQLRGCMGELAEVSVLLQTGRDKPAMEIVIRFADVVQSLMDLLPFLPPDTDRARILVELTPILRDLVAAFGSRDSVLIGDLLEYEVAPRMQKIVPLLEKAVVPKEPG